MCTRIGTLIRVVDVDILFKVNFVGRTTKLHNHKFHVPIISTLPELYTDGITHVQNYTWRELHPI